AQQQQGLPPEGPAAEEAAPVVPPPAGATASILRQNSAQQVGSGIIAAQPAAAAQQPSARPVSYEEALRSYQSRSTPKAGAIVETAWEVWTAQPADFASRQDAVTALSLARTTLLN